MVLHSWLVVLLEEEGGEQSSEPVMHVRGRSGRVGAAAGRVAAVIRRADRAAQPGSQGHGGGLELERQLDALQQSLGVQIELLTLDPKDMVEDWSESVALLQLERQLGTLQQSVGVQIDLLNLDPKDMVEDWTVSEGVSEWVAWQLERQLDALQQSLGVQIELLNLGWSGGLEGAC
ncbi:unnamed protein product [Closterium sp. Naga37s-1]|nr:unnamed protein product [Closterium sp. Naga37s-1]